MLKISFIALVACIMVSVSSANQSINYADKLHGELAEAGNKRQELTALVRLGYYYKDSPDSLLAYINKLQNSIGNHYEFKSAMDCLNAIYYAENTDIEKACRYIELASETVDTSEKSVLTIIYFQSAGRVEFMKGNYAGSFNYYLKSSYISTDIANDNGFASAQYAMGNILMYYCGYDEAMECLQNAESYCEKTDNTDLLNMVYLRLSELHYFLGNYELANYYGLITLNYFIKYSENRNLSIAYNVVGCMLLFDSTAKAGDMLYNAISSAKYKYDIANSLSELGNYYYNIGEYNKAVDYYRQSIEMSKQQGLYLYMANGYQLLSDYHNDIEENIPLAIMYIDSSLNMNIKLGRFIVAKKQCDSLISYCNKSHRECANYWSIRARVSDSIILSQSITIKKMRENLNQLNKYIESVKSELNEVVRRNERLWNAIFIALIFVISSYIFIKLIKKYKKSAVATNQENEVLRNELSKQVAITGIEKGYGERINDILYCDQKVNEKTTDKINQLHQSFSDLINNK